MQFRGKQLADGVPLRTVHLDFTNQLFIQNIGDFQYTGGVPITPDHSVDDGYMRKMVEHSNNSVLGKLFGKKWRKDKQHRPITFVFFENGSATAQRHFHTITSFPKNIIGYADRYMSEFAKTWMTWRCNQVADREFWYEKVRNNDAITRYTKKKMIAEQETWFVLN
tara:strand:+ start:371 stop:868 length:498 start_codon:yes stop_codon:yes gene_type:complete